MRSLQTGSSEMGLGEAKKIIGSIGAPSKMPGSSYGLPARNCIAGSKLAKIPGTVCSVCYAIGSKAKYAMPRAALGQRKRLAALSHPRWIEAMVRVLTHMHSKPFIKVDLGIAGVRLQRSGGSRFRYNETGYHRWMDSGDLQSIEHLGMICEVARQTPKIKHWLPTQELGMVRAFLKSGGVIPDNLVIRVSSVMIDDTVRRAWPLTSSVFSGTPPAGASPCPAPNQDHRCMSCRNCWEPSIPHIYYERH